MRHYVTSLCLFVMTLIVLFSICVLTCSAKMTQYLYDKETDIIVTKGNEALSSAKDIICESLSDAAIIAERTAYSDITSEMYDNDIQITEEAANDLFVKRYLDNLMAVYITGDGDLKDGFKGLLHKPPLGSLSMSDAYCPAFAIDNDSVTVKDIGVSFEYEDMYINDCVFDVRLPIHRIVLYDENPDFFEYSLVAKKGIYITGKTSTIIGNVYAGTHEPSQARKAEALYGEKNIYGGININATQLAFYSDKIVTDGIVNMKGSFVLIGKEGSPTDIFAHALTQTDIIASRSILEHTGSFKEINGDNPDISMINQATVSLDDIEVLYDTVNDGGYMGSYRKIISSDDITVTQDVEGVIITPKNVIIEEGVNIVGIVIAGDRIYIQGDNNIVGSSEVLRRVVKEELHPDNGLEEEYMHIHVSDYIGGIEARGIK